MFEDLNEFLKGKDARFEAEMLRINKKKPLQVKINRNKSKGTKLMSSTVYQSNASSQLPISMKDEHRKMNRQ